MSAFPLPPVFIFWFAVLFHTCYLWKVSDKRLCEAMGEDFPPLFLLQSFRHSCGSLLVCWFVFSIARDTKLDVHSILESTHRGLHHTRTPLCFPSSVEAQHLGQGKWSPVSHNGKEPLYFDTTWHVLFTPVSLLSVPWQYNVTKLLNLMVEKCCDSCEEL